MLCVEVPAQIGGNEHALQTFVVGLEVVELIQTLQGCFGVGVLNEQARNHQDGRQHAAAEDGGGDECAHGHVSGHHDHGADHNNTGVAQLLQRCGKVGHALGGVAHLQIVGDGVRVEAEPAREELPAAGTGLDGFHAVHGLDEKTGFLIGVLGAGFSDAVDTAARGKADQQGGSSQQQRHGRHPGAGDPGDEHQEDHAHGHVHQGKQGARGVEVAHLLVAAHLPGQRAHGGGQLVDANLQQPLKDFAREPVVEPDGDVVHDARAHEFQGQLDQDAQHDPDAEHGQGVLPARGNDAVVDLHGKQRGHQRQQTNEDGGHHGFAQAGAVQAHAALEDAAEVADARGVFRRGLAGALFLPIQQPAGALQLAFVYGALTRLAADHPTAIGLAVCNHKPPRTRCMTQKGQVHPVGLRQALGRGVAQRVHHGAHCLRPSAAACALYAGLQTQAVEREVAGAGDEHDGPLQPIHGLSR